MQAHTIQKPTYYQVYNADPIHGVHISMEGDRIQQGSTTVKVFTCSPVLLEHIHSKMFRGYSSVCGEEELPFVGDIWFH